MYDILAIFPIDTFKNKEDYNSILLNLELLVE